MVNKKVYLGIGGSLVLVVALFFIFGSNGVDGYPALKDYKGSVDFHKSQSCGCCGIHSNYLSRNGGLKIKEISESVEEVDKIKDEYGVPIDLRTCHTAVIGEYFVEGHVPLEAINKLMEEKPDIAGIALPGMPAGSPGMPGTKNGEWIIYSVNHDGSYEEFMRI